ncbi:hypothetical protein F2P56_011135 [Juglans regia]|uniref:TMV resistance protein N-like n=1 Tax=Juglans regia TaxID=51240 RepID=A0A833XP42_JUGRE|nr:hypothetical protein F2P56_011135 [Juglans regia]
MTTRFEEGRTSLPNYSMRSVDQGFPFLSFPKDVRNQTGTFAESFTRHEELFQKDMMRVKTWRAALTEAANCSGWDLETVNGYEAKFIDKIIKAIFHRLHPNRLNVAKNTIGIDFRVVEMKSLLHLEQNDVRIISIHGMSGIGKTVIAKAVYNQVSDGFEGSCFLRDIKETGICLINECLAEKKVLVVLDDVDHVDQLDALAGNNDWFGVGSRIITTTKDEDLLKHFGNYEKYKVEELTCTDSLELFSWHAIKMPHPMEDYHELSISVVKYTGGHPLALKVLGSFLMEKSIIEWISTVEELQKMPDRDIQKVLQVSFDSLDKKTKKIFLDIACFFIGMDAKYVAKILHGCGTFPDGDINNLARRSVVIIDLHGKLRMHDLIRDIGREIVRKSSRKDPGRRSRLWFYKDVLNVLHSEHMVFNKLKVLNLSYSKNLCKSPCFSQVSHLEILVLEGCINLIELHDSIRYLEGLVLLNLKGCKNLRNLPKSISKLESLKTLNLSGCLQLEKLPENLGNMIALKELFIGGTAIKQLPSSFIFLMNWKGLSLSECKEKFSGSWLSHFFSWLSPRSLNPRTLSQASVSGFGTLGKLALRHCNLSEDKIPLDLGGFSCLQGLDLSENNFRILPESINGLSKLKSLFLQQNTSLYLILGLPASIQTLSTWGCSSLETLSFSSSSELAVLYLGGCCNLVDIQGLNLESNIQVDLVGCDNLSSDFRESVLQCTWTKYAPCNRLIIFPTETSHIWWLEENCIDWPRIKMAIHNKTKGYRQVILPATPSPLDVSYLDNLFLFRWSILRNKFVMLGNSIKIMELVSGDEIEFSFDLGAFAEVKSCGVHVLVDAPNIMDENAPNIE